MYLSVDCDIGSCPPLSRFLASGKYFRLILLRGTQQLFLSPLAIVHDVFRAAAPNPGDILSLDSRKRRVSGSHRHSRRVPVCRSPVYDTDVIYL